MSIVRRGLHFVTVGPFAICWRDAWTHSWGLALEWTPRKSRGRTLFALGFRGRHG